MNTSRKNKQARRNRFGGVSVPVETATTTPSEYQKTLDWLRHYFILDTQSMGGDEDHDPRSAERAFLESLVPVDDRNFSPRKREIVGALRELTAISAPSFYETPVTEYLGGRWARSLRQSGNREGSLFRDPLGGILARLDSGKDGPVIVIDAHIDEVGFPTLTSLSAVPESDGTASSMLVAKSMDNRASVAIMDRLVQRLRPSCGCLYFTGSTREERGMAGALAAVRTIKKLERESGRPIDLVIVLDAAGVPNSYCEYPDEPHLPGEGPIIGSLDGDPRANNASSQRACESLVRQVATEKGISYQRSPLQTKLALTNGRQYRQYAEAVLTVQLPCWNMHSEVEEVDHRDLESTYDLMAATLEQLSGAKEWE